MGAALESGPRASTVHVFELDPDLARGLDGDEQQRARRLAVPVLDLASGPCSFPAEDFDGSLHFGLLILEGVLIRRVTLSGSTGGELLGTGDLLQPWVVQPPQGMLAVESSWEVLEPARLAVLDRSFAAAVSHWPVVAAALVGRAVERTRLLAFQHAASHVTGLGARVLALLWSLADRWGRVTPDGVLVPFRLTHTTLSQLVGASRPSVSTALTHLRRSELLVRRDDGWLLLGPPPDELRQLVPRPS